MPARFSKRSTKSRGIARKISGRLPQTASEPGLASNTLFEGLPAAYLSKLFAAHPVQEFPASHMFFSPGFAGHSLFLLEQGHVQTYRAAGNKKLIISELDPPAVFGEMGCVGPGIYHCHAATTVPSLVRVIPKHEVEAVLRNYPEVTRRLLDLVCRRFINVLLDLDSTSFRNLIPRLAALLLARADGEYVRNITHQSLAEHLRVYRESTTAALGELRKAGIISLHRKQIHILDRLRLERASRES
jgi:CRP-like cAMP-binding protein